MISHKSVCKRHKSKKLEAVTGDLPNERVKDARVFEVIGIDYVGLLFLKRSQKTWICLFTCAIYRTIYLELTTSLSTEAFLQALRRLIAQRGRPSIILTESILLEPAIYFTKLTGTKFNFRSAQRIEWRLNPPSATWGERMVEAPG